MTSKNSFFDLMKENMKRRASTFVLSSLFFIFYFPVGTLLSSDMYLKNPDLMKPEEILRAKRCIYNAFVSMHQSTGGSIILWLCVLALVTGFGAFSYLHEQRKTDFYHSLPVSRKTLFSVNVVNSLVMTAVPYFIGAMLSAAVAFTKTGYTDCFIIALTAFIQCFGFYALLLMTAVLSMMLTGNRLVGILGAGVFYLWGPVIVFLVFGLMSTYFKTYFYRYDYAENIMQYTSPLFWSLGSSGISINVRVLAAYIISILLFIINIKLYIMRPSESAGSALVYKYTKAPIKFIIVIPAAVSCGLIFSRIMSGSDLWTVFAVICGCIIVHCLTEIIYSFDFKKLFAHKIQLAACLVLSIFVTAFFRFDFAGFDSYIPEESKFGSAGLFTNGAESIYSAESDITLNDDADYCYVNIDTSEKNVVDRMQLADYNTLKAVAEAGIQASKNDNSYYTDTDDNTYMDNVLIGWHLNNGKTIYRQYYMNLKDISAELEKVIDSDSWRRGTYPILADSESAADDITGVNYEDALGFHHINFADFDDNDAKSKMSLLYRTYHEELSGLTADARRKESPAVTLQFKDSYIQSIADILRKQNGGYYGQLNYALYYPVYPSFTKTLALLEEYGVRINENIDESSISTIVISDSRGYREAEDGHGFMPKADLIITDKAQIREILNASRYDLNCTNSLYPQSYDVNATAHLTKSYTDMTMPVNYYESSVSGTDRDRGFAEGGIISIENGNNTAADAAAETESTVYIDEIHTDESSDDPANEEAAAAENETISDQKAVSDYYSDSFLYADGTYDSPIGSIQLYFNRNNIPEFVKEYFELDDTDSSLDSYVW